MNPAHKNRFRFAIICVILLLPSLAMAQSPGYRDWSGVIWVMGVLLVLAAASTLVFPVGILISLRADIRSLKWSILTLAIASLGGAAVAIAQFGFAWCYPEEVMAVLRNPTAIFLLVGGSACVVMTAITMAMYRIRMNHLAARSSR